MENVIDAKSRFFERRAASAPATLGAKLRLLKRLPAEDRVKLASGLGRLAALISPENPLEGAKRLFSEAGFESKWPKRKRLIRLPSEDASEPGEYGSYEAAGPIWVTLTEAAAKLLNPHVDGHNLLRAQDRLLRQVTLGTSLNPQHFISPSDVSSSGELLAEQANALKFSIGKETGLLDFWDLLIASPFALERVYPETIPPPRDQLEIAGPVAALRWGEGKLGFFSSNLGQSTDWAFPTVRLGVLEKQLNGRIYIPPRHIRAALRDPFDWTESEDGPNQLSVSAWLEEEGVTDQEYDPDLEFGWVTMPMTTTQSVFLQACPRANGEIGLWIKVHESFLDNFVPRLPGFDLVEEAYKLMPWAIEGYEPFGIDEGEDTFPGLGILTWPDWCKDFVGSEPLWRGGLLGVFYHVDDLAVHDHAGADRVPRLTADPPNLVSGQTEPWLDVPEGIGGWIDDTSNRELMAAIFANPPGYSFRSLIAEEREVEAPCRAGTIGETLLRNLAGLGPDRLDQLMIQQASTIVQAGTSFHQGRIDRYRAHVSGLLKDEANNEL